ncbi:MAG: GDSL-type esterase/lipase family protein [bacterium]|nr:GDSL-type esterase/lipase family protein [bacterium]
MPPSASLPPKPRRRLRRRLLAITIGLLVGAIVLEIGSAIAVNAGLFSARVPTYAIGKSAATFWGDLNPEFGVWHPPHTSFRHQKACFDVTYESNSYGARDVERERVADHPRVVVLGDSFMEGYGVAREERLSDVLERETGTPFLNFGTSGNAGSTHAFALYSRFAMQFRHDAVLAAILPENDFDDDVPKPDRYQAYWAGGHPDFELRYTLPNIEQSSYRYRAAEAEFDLQHFLREFTYTKNVVDLLYSAHKQSRARQKIAGQAGQSESRFFRFEAAELQRLCHSYERLAAAAAPRPVVLFTIPRLTDFADHVAKGSNPLDDALAEWAAEIDNLHFVPLLPALVAAHGNDLSQLFLSCDAHWSATGHRAAAQILLERAGKHLLTR